MQATSVAAPTAGTASPAPSGGLRSIGAKAIMALTGAALTLFVIAHMLGNLQIYLGREAVNSYAAKLKGMPELLWMARLGLLAVFLTHISLAIRLSMRNKEARPVAYVYQATRQATLASRTMLPSGLILLAFVIFHLAHFTLGVVAPDAFDKRDALGRHDVYGMVVAGFQVWWIVVAYAVAMLLLGLHLSHGVASLFQSLGIAHPRYTGWIRRAGMTVALVLLAGNLSMPLAVLIGFVR
jgi:succinate dehydrogenase / fumarate reductase, cytochrome b subunit